MTVTAVNALYRYFQALYNVNQHLIILCGVDVLDNEGQYQEHVEEVVLLIPRLVPYSREWRNYAYGGEILRHS